MPESGRDYSLLRSIQTGSWFQPTSYPVGTGGLFPPDLKRPGRETDHSSPSGAHVKKYGVIPPLPMHLHVMFIKSRDNFTYLILFQPRRLTSLWASTAYYKSKS
jgi:hypothetical protein